MQRFYDDKEAWAKKLDEILPPLDTDKDTTLLLAGDTGSMHKPGIMLNILETMSKRFKIVKAICGNHEFYGGSLLKTEQEIQHAVWPLKNVKFGNGCSVLDNGRTLIQTTLWTDFDKNDQTTMRHCRNSMNDYRHCGGEINEAYPMTPEDIYKRHCIELGIIKNYCQPGDIIMTHHLPSFLSIDPVYKDSDLNGAFASDLDSLILTLKPALWIHGHTHASNDYMIGTTRIISNPRGYEGGTNRKYNPTLVIEI